MSIKSRIRNLEKVAKPNGRKILFFWKGEEKEKELARLSPEERERAIIFRWIDEGDTEEDPGSTI